LTFDEKPTLGEEHKSLMSKVLNQEVFDKLKDVKSSKVRVRSYVTDGGTHTHRHRDIDIEA
jgi:hypothetical protein